MREKGTNRHEFQLGKVSKYSWVERGSSYLLAEVNCAILWSQLQDIDFIFTSRKRIVEEYSIGLNSIGEFDWQIMKLNNQVAHIFAIKAPNRNARDEFIHEMALQGITTVSHYEDLANSTAGMKFGKSVKACKNSVNLSERIVRLPLYVELKELSVKSVVNSALSAVRKIQEL